MEYELGTCESGHGEHPYGPWCVNWKPLPRDEFSNGTPVAIYDAPPPQLTMEEFNAR